jgi:protein-tyrosine phosphatase
MIDFHTHILPALDDGAITVDDSIAMAKALASFGYKTVCCTPHCIKGYYDLTSQQVREATLMLQADLDNEGIDLELWPGMEYMLDEYFSEFAEDLLPLGNTKLVLCEAPPQAHPVFVQEGFELIIDKGFVPLVAHPERTPFFYEKLSSGKEERGKREGAFTGKEDMGGEQSSSKGFLKKFWPFASHVPRPASLEFQESSHPLPLTPFLERCIFHANLGSFTGFYGQKVQRNAYELLKHGAYTALASDLHESRTAADVLVQDKFDNNPFLEKLAEFDGTVPEINKTVKPGEGEQFGLF